MFPPGAGPRQLSARRKLAAVGWLIATIWLVGVPFALPIMFGWSKSIWLIFFSLAAARCCYLQYKDRWSEGLRADYGAKAEDEVYDLLKTLPKGWKTTRNVPLPGVGDVDFYVHAPDATFFIVDIKAHSGIVRFDGQSLVRGKSSGDEPFERDFLESAARQALGMKEKFGAPLVIPVLAFTRAKLDLPRRKLRGVYVIHVTDLVSFLTQRPMK